MTDHATPGPPPADPRRDLLLAGLSRSARIVEVGASFRPLAPKRAGWNTCVVDHDTRAGLVAKYAGAAITPDDIEEVDVLWQQGALHDAFPVERHGTFDALVASHVLEHMPDLIAFLDSARRLLTADGCLVFALPDKRWCFDFFRPVSLAGDVLLAHSERRTRHTAATLYNEVAYAVTLDGRPGWAAGEPAANLAFAHPLGRARQVYDEVRTETVYRDAHAWQFTPASFELLILDLSLAGACDWRVDWIRPAAAVEFLGRLRPGAARLADEAAVQRRRRALLFAMAREVADQARSLMEAAAAA
jgi:SAM-dependent methyltransferase